MTKKEFIFRIIEIATLIATAFIAWIAYDQSASIAQRQETADIEKAIWEINDRMSVYLDPKKSLEEKMGAKIMIVQRVNDFLRRDIDGKYKVQFLKNIDRYPHTEEFYELNSSLGDDHVILLDNLALENLNDTSLSMPKAGFYRCKVKNFSIGSMIGSGGGFLESNLIDAKFYYINMSEVTFEDSNLTNVDFSKANLTKAIFKKNSMKNVNFSGADFSKVNWNGKIFPDKTICQEGSINECKVSNNGNR